ncbi:hypothetical protein [Peribacillus sp. NPDC058075]|uniref:hypothetical protein n=1 Tax=unclassified Peribacillus TaxID=2675266 RepID=UPI0036DD9B7A
MDLSVSKKGTNISYIIAFVLISSMVTMSVMFDDPEIILPEIAAMAIAMWVYREPGWVRQPSKIFLAPSITALIGFMVNQLPLTYIGKIILTLVLMMFFLYIIRTNLAPSLATGLLPLVVNAHEWSFILSVLVFTLILMLGVIIFELNKGLEKKVKIQYKYMLVFLVLNFVWIGMCWVFGFQQLAVIPPIVVVVYESLQKPMYNGKMALKQVLVLSISATVGTLLYFLINSWILVTLLDMVLMLILLRIAGMRIPAVYAFPLLPFIFPENVIPMIPLGALISSVFLFGSVLVYKKFEMKCKRNSMEL